MNGNFNPDQNLKNGDMTVDARGWLRWGPLDKSAEIAITVTQDGSPCSGPVMTCEAPSDKWQRDVTRAAPPPWSKARGASGQARAVVTKQDGTTYVSWWDSPPLTLR
jgi:hypothetical protein